MGRHPGIDFLWILVDFWRQVGVENRSKIDPRRHRKNDQTMESKMQCLLASIFDRFLIDFGGFLDASWGRKSIKNRSKKASNN